MTTLELIAYYKNLLIIQYNNLARAAATVGAFVSELIGDQIIAQVNDGFNLDNAVGVQLNTLATYRGVGRNWYSFSLDREYFTMPAYGDPGASTADGFGTYPTAASVTWYWELYTDSSKSIHILTDAELRTLVRFRADVQHSDYSVKAIDDVLFKYFQARVSLSETGNMDITYTHSAGDPSQFFDIVNNTGNLPHPAGVAVHVIQL